MDKPSSASHPKRRGAIEHVQNTQSFPSRHFLTDGPGMYDESGEPRSSANERQPSA